MNGDERSRREAVGTDADFPHVRQFLRTVTRSPSLLRDRVMWVWAYVLQT